MTDRSDPSADTHLQVEQAGGVVTLTISGEADANRLTPTVLARFEALAAEWRDSDSVHVIIITGSGQKWFSAGILHPKLRGELNKDEVIRIVRLANGAFDAVDALPQIVIAALNGQTWAGAAELALACDIRVAAAHATMMFPEATWGGFPGAGGPYRLATAVGRGRALELICTGREVGATELERIGLVQAVHPGAGLKNAALAMASRIAAAGPLATRGAKRLVRARSEPGLQSARELSDALRYALEWSEDVAEGIAAHSENRSPVFKGR